MSDPLIVTLALDPASAERLDALRREHFPPERNHLRAHVTLFHALPGDQRGQVVAVLAGHAARAPFDVAVTGLRSLGRGVAFALASPDAEALRAQALRDVLVVAGSDVTAQDRQRLRLHVTVANKIEPPRARALLAELTAGFVPWSATARGLDVWHYRGGPWELAEHLPFEEPADPRFT